MVSFVTAVASAQYGLYEEYEVAVTTTNTQTATSSPTTTDTPTQADEGVNEFLFSTLGIALVTLRYVGLTIIVLGAVLWGTSKKSTKKSKRGIWMIYTGAFMLAIYFGWSTFVEFITYFTEISLLNQP
jgi:hypothetical protein